MTEKVKAIAIEPLPECMETDGNEPCEGFGVIHAALTAAQSRIADLEARLRGLLNAVDEYGVECWDTDSFSGQVQRIWEESEATRTALQQGGE